jgi:hypothetical protein
VTDATFDCLWPMTGATLDYLWPMTGTTFEYSSMYDRWRHGLWASTATDRDGPACDDLRPTSRRVNSAFSNKTRTVFFCCFVSNTNVSKKCHQENRCCNDEKQMYASIYYFWMTHVYDIRSGNKNQTSQIISLFCMFFQRTKLDFTQIHEFFSEVCMYVCRIFKYSIKFIYVKTSTNRYICMTFVCMTFSAQKRVNAGMYIFKKKSSTST